MRSHDTGSSVAASAAKSASKRVVAFNAAVRASPCSRSNQPIRPSEYGRRFVLAPTHDCSSLCRDESCPSTSLRISVARHSMLLFSAAVMWRTSSSPRLAVMVLSDEIVPSAGVGAAADAVRC
eukprot:6417739-Prymnesium_polylepis.1